MGIHFYDDVNVCFCPRVVAKQSQEGPWLFSSSLPYAQNKVSCDFWRSFPLACYYPSPLVDNPTISALITYPPTNQNLVKCYI